MGEKERLDTQGQMDHTQARPPVGPALPDAPSPEAATRPRRGPAAAGAVAALWSSAHPAPAPVGESGIKQVFDHYVCSGCGATK